ncbi:MAG: protein kinase [Acidobacteriia bacterium]|nr:protein kinase [Terriglobia bacterium]
MRLTSGTRLGSYEIISPLGAGGMGEVYLAQDTKLDRTVALKILPAAFASDPHRLQRFLREAKAASSLNHPNILTIYEVSAAEPFPLIAAEYIEGETLRRHLARRRMSILESLDVAIQVASALSAAHSVGIIHRDIKPENIMLRPDEYVKVLDFGLAKVLEPEKAEDPTVLGTITQFNSEPGLVLGTARYMSPEQARGLETDGRTDLWSLGVVLFEMVAGTVPFGGNVSTEIIASVLVMEPPPLARFSREVPEELERIVTKALAKNREERFQTARDFLLDLKGLKKRLETDTERIRRGQFSWESGQGTPGSDDPAAISSGDHMTPWSRTSGIKLASGPSGLVARIKAHKAIAAIVLAALGVAIFVSYTYFLRNTLNSIDSIAVLPFSNADPDPETQYFSDGITENTINSLSQLPHLAVIAGSSVFRYKGQEIDPQTVGRRLKVQAVLTGRVIRRNDDLTISVELVDVRNNHHLWGEQYNRKISGILSLQSELAGDICEKLRSTLTREEHDRATRHYTENTEAYNLYTKGRYYWNRRTGEDVKTSIEYFEKAIALDPRYAQAYAGLADAYIALPVYSDVQLNDALPKAKNAALKALAIDDTLAEAHTSLAGSIGQDDWYFKGAEKEFRRAIALNPNYATARQWYAQFLSTMGRHAEAFDQIRQARELDPLSLIIQTSVGNTLLKARLYDQGIEQLEKAIEMDRNFYRAHLYLGNAYLEKGMYDRAIGEFKIAAVLSGEESPEEAATRATALMRAYETSGAKGYWAQQLNYLEEEMKTRHVSPYKMAFAYAWLGESNLAIEWLQKAFQERDINFLNLKIDPQFDSLRTDQRVLQLMRRVELPEWSGSDSNAGPDKRNLAVSTLHPIQ